MCFIVRDANGQALAYIYFEEEPGRRSAAHLPRRGALTIAKLPAPLLRDARLRSSQPSIHSKAVVDAELYRLDGLLNVNPWHDFGDTSNRPGQ
jgi:hypothetical protein